MQRIDEVRAQFEAMLTGVRATMWRDDCMLVPSDIRQLVGEIDRLGAENARLRRSIAEILDRPIGSADHMEQRLRLIALVIAASEGTKP